MRSKFLSIVTLLALVAIVSGCSGSSNGDETSQLRSYPTSVASYAVVNPSQISVAFVVKNDGSKPVEPSCKVKATDGTGTYKGVYMGIQDSIEPGVSQRLVAQIEVTNEGADYVTEVTAECQANTTDTSSSAGKEVIVSDVSECGGDDGSTYYWAPCFTVDAERGTMMTCMADALDSEGSVIASMTYKANTANNGFVTGYGDGAGTQDVTEKLYKSIKSLAVSCTL
jgi:hypothetical protein